MARGLFRHPPQPLQRKGTPELLVAPPAATCYRDAVIADTPVAYWRLGEPSGTALTDEMGALTAAYQNSPTLGVAGALSGDSNTAVTFNGTDEYAFITAFALPNEDIFTVEAWVNWADDTTNDVIFDRGDSGPRVLLNNSGFVRFDKANVATIATSTVALSVGVWTHVAVTKNGATVKQYINGVDRTGTVTNATMTPNVLVGSGIASENSGASFFTGTLDEVALYGTDLTQAQIQAHYDARSVSCGGSTVNVTASDSIATTDSVARVVTNLRTTSDSIGLADTVARVVTNLRTLADSIGVSDSVARVLTNLRTAADSISVGNTVARVLTNLRTTGDSLGISESVARVVTNLRTAADAIGISEAVAGIKVVPRTVADAISISDSVARTGTFLRTVADSISVGNTVARVVTNLRTAADSISITESVAGLKVILRTAADSVSVGDSVARVVTNLRTVADSITVGNTVSRTVTNLRTATDNLTIGDVVARVATLIRTAADSVGVNESVDGQVTHGGGNLVQVTASDSITITDSVSRTVINIRTVDDNVIFVDVVSSTGGAVPPGGGHPGRGRKGGRVPIIPLVPPDEIGDDDEDFLLGVI